jgi:hypothetical protein
MDESGVVDSIPLWFSVLIHHRGVEIRFFGGRSSET